MRFGVENPLIHQASAAILDMPAGMRILWKVSLSSSFEGNSTYLDTN